MGCMLIFTDHKSLQYVFSQRNLNLKQRRWLQLQKNYNISVLYHLEKENMVIDALSRKFMNSITHVKDERKRLVRDVHRLTHFDMRLSDFKEEGRDIH